MHPVNAQGQPVEGEPLLLTTLYFVQHYLDSRYTDNDSRKIVFSYSSNMNKLALAKLVEHGLAKPIPKLSILYDGVTSIEDVQHFGQPYQLLAWFE